MNTFGDICTVRQGLQIPISKRLTEYEDDCYEYITVQYLHGGKAREYIKSPKPTVICSKDDILMRCNAMEYVPGIISLLEACKEEQIPMYVFVGDMYETDVKGASGAGISVAWINRKNESDEKHLATYSVSGMEQLQEIINSHFVTE